MSDDSDNTPTVTLEDLQAQLTAATESIGKLEAKNQELLTEKKTASKAAQEAEEARKLAAEEAARKNGDVESLDKSWSEKYAALQESMGAQIAERESQLDGVTSGATALQMANELAVEGSAKGLLPHIAPRLKTEFRDGKPVTVVLDASGNVSAMTVDELKTEISNAPYLASMVVGSKASGSGGTGGGKGASGPIGKASYTGSTAEKTNQAIKAVPALANLPRN